ncbi:hypothetical protein D3C72_2275560 [compost metagenome]
MGQGVYGGCVRQIYDAAATVYRYDHALGDKTMLFVRSVTPAKDIRSYTGGLLLRPTLLLRI